MADCGGAATGAANRRRGRRLRSHWRREKLAIQMALSEAMHHSAPRCAWHESNAALRGQKPDSASTQYFKLDVDEWLADGGSRPLALLEAMPQDRVQRRTAGHISAAVGRHGWSTSSSLRRGNPNSAGAGDRPGGPLPRAAEHRRAGFRCLRATYDGRSGWWCGSARSSRASAATGW